MSNRHNFKMKSFLWILLSLLLCAAVAQAQSASQKAWGILQGAAVDSSPEKRANAMAAFGMITRDAQAQAIAEKALSDPKPEVRAAAASALGDMQAISAVPKLKVAVKDKDPSVVVAAAHALYVLKHSSAYEVYYAVHTGQLKSGKGLMADQKKMLSDPRKMAQFGFEQGVGFVPFAGVGLTAIRAVTKDDSSPVRAAAAKNLANDPDPLTARALVAAASDKNWIVRVAAIDAISRRGDRTLAASLEPRLEDEKDLVKYVAAAAIIHLNSAASTKAK